ncbi:MAG: glycosidase [Chloroflexi bacterium CSP1-4]|nr:MAG: glycosidase [Chloroflexi bacterium CSP1-4]
MVASVELFSRFPANPIVTVDDLPYRANSVFNPGAALVDGETILLMRVEDRRGLSHLTVARSRDGLTGWTCDPEPGLRAAPERHPEEVWGLEDPRLTWLPEEGHWVIAYTAFSRRGPLVSLATTTDFRTFTRLGPVMPPEDKDAALFPRRFDGRWLLVHRPTPLVGGAHIWTSASPDLRYWGDQHLLLEAREGGWWDARKIGLGPPPLETPDGWLIMYHGVRTTASGSLYRSGLALLDLEEPNVVLNRSDDWVLGPEAPYERAGDVADIVFPCGWVHDEGTDTLRVYYGAADTSVAVATARLSDVLAYVKSCPPPQRRRHSDQD